MSRLRQAKRRMRADVHREGAVRALYIPAPSATPVPCTVRVWLKTDQFVKPMGSTDAAQMAEPEDRLRFDLSQFSHALFRNAVVSIEPGEAYRIDHLYPADLGYQTARVIPLKAAETTALPVPD